MTLRGRGVLLGRQGAGSTPGCPSKQRGTAEVSGAEPPGPCWGSRGARNTGQGEGWAGGCPCPVHGGDLLEQLRQLRGRRSPAKLP